MVQAVEAYNRAGETVWYGQFRLGLFWRTVRDDSGNAVPYHTEAEAITGAREEWVSRVPREHRLRRRKCANLAA